MPPSQPGQVRAPACMWRQLSPARCAPLGNTARGLPARWRYGYSCSGSSSGEPARDADPDPLGESRARTGRNLPELSREHFPRPTTRGLWVQAELLATGILRRPSCRTSSTCLLRGQRVDVLLVMGLAGLVNMSMLVIAAALLHGSGISGTDTIEGALDPAGSSPLAHPGPRPADPRPRHRPDPRTRALPGRAVVRDPVRVGPPGPADASRRHHGRPGQPPRHHCHRSPCRRRDHRPNMFLLVHTLW